MELTAAGYQFRGLDKINVILGKNGCGKSTILKAFESALGGEEIGRKKYITPERGGVLLYQPGVEQNLVANPAWLADTRRVNQYTEFKQQSTAQFRRLEMLYFREAETRKVIANFEPNVARLNDLLDNIELRRSDPTFKLFDRLTDSELQPKNISSGESELISLGIEILTFANEREIGKMNLLLLDEPDVHLHPDLQSRLTRFLSSLIDEYGFHVVIATHSTAILGGLADYVGATVSFMKTGDKALAFEPISRVHRSVLPVFGAHPLSNIFNKAPVIVVEGEDDQRIWQQVTRTSVGKRRLYPVACEGVSNLSDYEESVNRIVSCVYDDGRAYSLRDGDGATDDPSDFGVVRRLRLKCRAAENLMLTNEVLASADLTMVDVESRVAEWLRIHSTHPKYDAMVSFSKSGCDRKYHDLKEIRMVLVGQIIGSNKPWEILIGQVLGTYEAPSMDSRDEPGSLADFLGGKILNEIFS